MIRILLTAFAMLTFAGTPTPANPTTVTRGDGVPIAGFYVANKGSGYTVGNTWVIIESADGNGFALAEVVLGSARNGRGQVIGVNLIYSDDGFTAPPTITIVGVPTGSGAVVFAVMGE